MQTTNTVLMIRPTRFSFNQDTAANNRFQQPDEYRVEQLLDLSSLEQQEVFLEGTGSMVLDRQQRICYAGYSARTHARALDQVVSHLGYELCAFNAVDRQGVAIYLMMSVGTRLAVACLASVTQPAERLALRKRLEDSGKQVIALNWAQLESFAGNMLEVRNAADEPLLVMSRTAWQSLDAAQRRLIEAHTTPLPVNIDTIERIGGGSARCMLAEVFLSKHRVTREQLQ